MKKPTTTKKEVTAQEPVECAEPTKPTLSLSQWSRILLCEGIKALAEAVSSRSDEEPTRIAHHLENCQRRITEVFSGLAPAPVWTEKEAELSGNMHAFLRKCCDSTITTLLYRQINMNVGMVAWQAFVAAIVDTSRVSVRDCLEAAHMAADTGGEDAKTTYLLIRGWSEEEGSIKEAIKWSKA